MNEEQKDKFGRLIDTLDNLAHALTLPIPDSIHVEAIRESLPEKVEDLKKIYQEVTGENPWE
jgi:hypothetical protein